MSAFVTNPLPDPPPARGRGNPTRSAGRQERGVAVRRLPPPGRGRDGEGVTPATIRAGARR
jgi:hypothetical protein